MAIDTPRTIGAVLGSVVEVSVTPTVTAGLYAANNILGGIIKFPNILPNTATGTLYSITAKFAATAVSGNINVAIFNQNPSNGTYADKTAATWNAADMAFCEGIFQLTSPLALGAATMTVYTLSNLAKSISGASSNLWAICTVAGTPTPASTTDFTLMLGLYQG